MTAPAAQKSVARQSSIGAGASFSEQPMAPPNAESVPVGPRLFVIPDLDGFKELRVWAETYEDQQDHRKRIMNRLGLKADGSAQETGARVPPDQFAGQVAHILAAEHDTALGMRRCYRRVAPPSVLEWQKATFGIGEHLLARLLGSLGHPRIATPWHWEGEGKDRTLVADLAFERTVRQLWSYCGHGDPQRKKRKGMSAEEAFQLGSPRAKMLVHLLAEASMKCKATPGGVPVAKAASAGLAPLPRPSAETPESDIPAAGGEPLPDGPIEESEGSPIRATVRRGSSADQPSGQARATSHPADRRYRAIYDQRRAHTRDREDWTDGHKHADALRIIGKQILADLWDAAAP